MPTHPIHPVAGSDLAENPRPHLQQPARQAKPRREEEYVERTELGRIAIVKAVLLVPLDETACIGDWRSLRVSRRIVEACRAGQDYVETDVGDRLGLQ